MNLKFDLPKNIVRIIKTILIAYAVTSIVYTSYRVYSLHEMNSIKATRRDTMEIFEKQQDYGEIRNLIPPESHTENDTLSDLMENVIIHSTKDDPSIHPSTAHIVEGDDFMIVSKAFQSSMGPSDILPYFFKANSKLNKNDITISTIITSDRFPHLSRLATHYKGPISAAIHITDNESKEEIMSSLYDVFNTNPDMREYVDVHLIVDKYNRQFNMWRNVAKLYTRTSYLMMLDIDFYICTNFRDYILYNPILMDMLERGNTALVIPAFEYISQSDGDDYTRFPTNKDQLLQEVADGRLDMFHRDWQRGHGSTNYTKWYSADEVYKVDEYNYSYEPYVIFKKETSPWCDERFIGYGANKAACLYEIYVSGIEYYVVPDDFLIHQSHAYPEERRKKEREFNKKVYSHFREELCLRYIRQYMADGTWNTSIANNLKTECQKIPGLKAIVNNL